MTLSNKVSSSAAIWQGYHHEWEYNHRINRMGSYVAQKKGKDGTEHTVVGHTAASGTGNDTAHFKDFVTEVIAAEDVAFQAGYAETVIECQRGDLTPFVIRIEDLELSPELQGCDTYTVVLNGFDIYALQHSEKIITFDIDFTEPTLNADGTKARLYVVGHLRFDCRSPECQLLPVRLESEAVHKSDMDHVDAEAPNPGNAPVLPPERPKRGLNRHKFDRAAHWFKRRMATLMGVDEVKRSLVDRDEDSTRRRLFRFLGRRFFLRFLKWELSAPYALRVHYLLIGGKRDAFATRETRSFEHTYRWDLEYEIQRELDGVLPIAVQADDAMTYAVNTLAFRQFWMDITIDEQLGTEDPVQWGRGMHLLEWSMAIRDIVTSENSVRAKLDLFYRCWSEAMNEVITFTTWGAVRGAGSARIGARLALLQFKNAEASTQFAMPGRIYWPGGGRSATRDPRAYFERSVGALVEES